MIFKYNMYFEISSLILLCIVFAHTNLKKSIGSFRNKFFTLFTWVGILDILFDIISTICISEPDIYSVFIQQSTLLILYLMQLVLPFMLFLYVIDLRSNVLSEHKILIRIASIPFSIMVLGVILNPWFGFFFSFNEENIYTRETFYPVMYIYGIVYLVACLADTIIHHKDIDFKHASVVWEFAIISGTTVAIQMVMNNVLLTGFGIAASIIIILLTLQNPMSNIDNLTGLYDINGLKEKLVLLKRRRTQLWVAIISLDNFKRINHVFGMEAGDKIINDIGQLVSKSAGDDNAFRFLGDNFLVTLYDKKNYDLFIKDVKIYFEQYQHINETECKITACICSIENYKIEKSVDDFLSFIDYIINQAKQTGSGTSLLVDDKIKEKYHRYKEIEKYIYEAIEKKLFDVYFQPIYSLKNNRFVSVEALARLEHPNLGSISPAEFIPIAEKSARVYAIDRCIFEKTCTYLSENKEVLKYINNVKFNVSPADLINANLGKNILNTIYEKNLCPQLFQFEITETAATQYSEELDRLISIMRNEGCGICLDDFGSGYANLDAVMRLPFDVVKLDKSMLYSAMESTSGEVLYRCIFNVMKNLKYVIVSEGAETEDEVKFLESIGADFIQGFYFAKPIQKEYLIDFFKKINSEI